MLWSLFYALIIRISFVHWLSILRTMHALELVLLAIVAIHYLILATFRRVT